MFIKSKRLRKNQLIECLKRKTGLSSKINYGDFNSAIIGTFRKSIISHKELIKDFKSHLKFKKKNASGKVNFFVKRKNPIVK